MSFILIKPDAVRAGQVGEILTRFERKGYRVVRMKYFPKAERSLIEAHYAEHKNAPFFERLCNYMETGPIVAIELTTVITGNDTGVIINSVRNMIGNLQQPGTIRGDFAKSHTANSIHASDSDESYARECMLWLGDRYIPVPN